MFLRHDQLSVVPRVQVPAIFKKNTMMASARLMSSKLGAAKRRSSATKENSGSFLDSTNSTMSHASSEETFEEPSFLHASLAQQRENFGLLNALEQHRLHNEKSGRSMEVATSRINHPRNRYLNVFPWDQTRVQLPVEGSHSDYINASYINIPNSYRYIASQGPLPSTIHHFWAMAFSEAVKNNNDSIIIVMVTPLVESGYVKCTQYWPTAGEPPLVFDEELKEDGIPFDLRVSYVNESYNTEGDYLVTELELQSGDTTKKVYHYYYRKWADAKVPPSIHHLLQLSKDIRLRPEQVVPIVHCSAGVGRTGTFIAIDHLRSHFHEITKKNQPGRKKQYDQKKDPILQTVLQLRESRIMMVQTVYQYCFLYECAYEIFAEL